MSGKTHAGMVNLAIITTDPEGTQLFKDADGVTQEHARVIIKDAATVWLANLPEDHKVTDNSLLDGGPMWLEVNNGDYTFNAAIAPA